MPDVDSKEIPGLERAAILLLSLGEQDAASVLRHMEPREVQKLGAAMATLQKISKDKADRVLADFIGAAQNETSLGIGSEETIRNMLINALGQDKASAVIDRILEGANTKGLEALKWMDPKAIAELIRLEHPQIIAIVLSYLEPDQSSETLSFLQDDIKHDVLMRIATLDSIQPSAIKELNEILEKHFSGGSNVASAAVGGKKTAADILNYIQGEASNTIMEKIKEADADMAQELEELMFVFEDLEKVDDRGIQALLKDISSDTLVVALKGASEGIKEKFFGNMSKRAAEMLRDDLEVKGPVRLSEVEAAHKEILEIARRMAEAGDIILGGQGGEEYV